jgi:hypothetical protein
MPSRNATCWLALLCVALLASSARADLVPISYSWELGGIDVQRPGTSISPLPTGDGYRIDLPVGSVSIVQASGGTAAVLGSPDRGYLARIPAATIRVISASANPEVLSTFFSSFDMDLKLTDSASGASTHFSFVVSGGVTPGRSGIPREGTRIFGSAHVAAGSASVAVLGEHRYSVGGTFPDTDVYPSPNGEPSTIYAEVVIPGVPEPSALLLAGAGCVGLLGGAIRKRWGASR